MTVLGLIKCLKHIKNQRFLLYMWAPIFELPANTSTMGGRKEGKEIKASQGEKMTGKIGKERKERSLVENRNC